MANRRKFLAGLGALATSSAAAMGTGALSTQEASRSVNVDIANDKNGSIGLDLSASSLENTEYAKYTNGQLTLQFDGRPSNVGASGSSGLNPDSTYYFDNVFQILNKTNEQLRVKFDKTDLDNPSAFTFYALSMGGGVIDSRDSNFMPGISSGYGVNIGVKIETPDSVPSNWETGSVNIIVEDKSDTNVGN